MAWHEAWGTWRRDSGVPENVAVIGGPNRTMFGLDLTRAKRAGYGKGIRFTSRNNAGTRVTVELNLIGASVLPDSMSAHEGESYRDPAFYGQSGEWDYPWYADIAYSTSGRGGPYRSVFNEQIAVHTTPQSLAYGTRRGSSWETANIDWAHTVDLPANFTHLRVEVYGERTAQRMYNYYTREIVVPPPPPPKLTTRFLENGTGVELYPPHTGLSFIGARDIAGYIFDSTRDASSTVRIHYYNVASIKPWAIRKNGRFKTIDRPSGFFKIRRAVNFVDKSNQLKSQVNRPNQGSSRIRKSDTWVGQNKIGEQ